MNELFKKVFEVIERYWHQKVVGIIAPLVTTAAVASFFYSPQTQKIPAIGWVLAGFLGVIVLWVWFLSNRIPRIMRGNVGVVVGIVCDSPEQDKQVKADFIRKLSELVRQGGARLELIELPSWCLQTITEAGNAAKYLHKTRGHFMLYGSVRRRNLNGRDAHFLNFEGLVRHNPLPPEVQRDLSMDFTTVLPRRIIIGVENDAFSFETASEWAELSARYVIGMAAFLSGSLAYAEALFLHVQAKLKQHGTAMAGLQQIARRLPERFGQLYAVWLAHLYEAYFSTRNRIYLVKSDEIASKILDRNPKDRRAMLQKAICEFVLRRNVTAAHKLITRCRSDSDSIWWYSRAFLHAYQGKMEEATADYRHAFAGPITDATVPIQCEEFIQIILAEEPTRVQLYFCLGLINFHAKCDYLAAERDLNEFVSRMTNGQFEAQIAEAQNLIQACRRKSCVEPQAISTEA